MDENFCLSKAAKRHILVQRIMCAGFVFAFTAVPLGIAITRLNLTLATTLSPDSQQRQCSWLRATSWSRLYDAWRAISRSLSRMGR